MTVIDIPYTVSCREATDLLQSPRSLRLCIEFEEYMSTLTVLNAFWVDCLVRIESPPRSSLPQLGEAFKAMLAERRRDGPNIDLYEKSKKRKHQLDFLKILWGLLDAIVELMQTVRVYIALILDTVSSGFSEFPNSMRPPCTTMPWTIWPALVVLWGVCWMFYTPLSSTDERQLRISLQDTEWRQSSSSGK